MLLCWIVLKLEFVRLVVDFGLIKTTSDKRPYRVSAGSTLLKLDAVAKT
jgi:hypothetical protein